MKGPGTTTPLGPWRSSLPRRSRRKSSSRSRRRRADRLHRMWHTHKTAMSGGLCVQRGGVLLRVLPGVQAPRLQLLWPYFQEGRQGQGRKGGGRAAMELAAHPRAPRMPSCTDYARAEPNLLRRPPSTSRAGAPGGRAGASRTIWRSSRPAPRRGTRPRPSRAATVLLQTTSRSTNEAPAPTTSARPRTAAARRPWLPWPV